MKHEDLFLLRYIFSSDDDGNPVEDIYVGYDEAFNLIVLIEHADYDFPEYNCCAYAVINKDEAFKLAKRLKASMTELPGIVSYSVDDEYYEIVNPSIRQTQECFRDILGCFANEKCIFRLVRTYGAYGYSCF